MRGASRALRHRPTASVSVPCINAADTLYGILPNIINLSNFLTSPFPP